MSQKEKLETLLREMGFHVDASEQELEEFKKIDPDHAFTDED